MDISVWFLCQIFFWFNLQKSAKSVHFWQNYSKNKRLDVFVTQCITVCISTFASKISILSVIFHDSEFYFFKFVSKICKNSWILRIFKIHQKILNLWISRVRISAPVIYAIFCDNPQVNSALLPTGVVKSSTSFGWGKGGYVPSAEWQHCVIPYGTWVPVAVRLVANCCILRNFTFTYLNTKTQSICLGV